MVPQTRCGLFFQQKKQKHRRYKHNDRYTIYHFGRERPGFGIKALKLHRPFVSLIETITEGTGQDRYKREKHHHNQQTVQKTQPASELLDAH